MGGVGKRFGSDTPKQFHRLSGKPIYLVTLEAFLQTALFDEIVLSCHPDWIAAVEKELQPSWPVRVVASGENRQASSLNGLLGFTTKPDVVLIHDAVRPFVSETILKENVQLAIAHGAVDTCISSADTLVYAPDNKQIASIPDRAHYLRGQTPQSFDYSLILQAHQLAKGGNASDDCRLVIDMGHPIRIAAGDEYNLKITSELDLFLAEQLFRLRRIHVPQGKETITGKIYAVIGGSGGIGQEICKKIAEQGATAISLSRSTGLDLLKPATIQQTFRSLEERHGPIDGLINCAGLLKVNSLRHLSLAEIEAQFQVNLLGPILSCQAVKLKEGAHIINIASSSFARGRKDIGIYSSAKAGLVNFTQALAEERPDLKIHAVIPQRTRTPMRLANFPGEEMASLLDPTEVATAVVHLLKDQHSTGQLLEVKKG